MVAYLVLDLTVATSRDDAAVRSAWTAMGLVVSWAIVPLALASVLTGVVIALGTKWGLFRHWWVLVSFVLTVLATVVLLSEARVVTRSAAIAAESTTVRLRDDLLQATALPLGRQGLGAKPVPRPPGVPWFR